MSGLFSDDPRIPAPRLMCLAATISICLGTYELIVGFPPLVFLGYGAFCFVGLVHVVVLGYGRRMARDACCKVAFLNAAVTVIAFTVFHPGARSLWGLPLAFVLGVLYAFVSVVFVFLGVLVGIRLMESRWQCLERAADADGFLLDEEVAPGKPSRCGSGVAVSPRATCTSAAADQGAGGGGGVGGLVPRR